MFDLKKYRGVIFHDTEEWCKIWRKTDLWFEKFHKFLPEHLKVSKLGVGWDLFVQSRKCMTLKFTEVLCVMTMKNNVKFEEELACHFNIDMRNLRNFDSSTCKSKKLLFNWLLWPKFTFELKKYRGVMFDGTDDWCKIWRKTDLCFQKWHKEFGKFLFTGWKIAISF